MTGITDEQGTDPTQLNAEFFHVMSILLFPASGGAYSSHQQQIVI